MASSNDTSELWNDLTKRATGYGAWLTESLKLIGIESTCEFFDKAAGGNMCQPPPSSDMDVLAGKILAQIRAKDNGTAICPEAAKDTQTETLRSLARIVTAAEPHARAHVFAPGSAPSGLPGLPLTERQRTESFSLKYADLLTNVAVQQRGAKLAFHQYPCQKLVQQLFESLIGPVGSKDSPDKHVRTLSTFDAKDLRPEYPAPLSSQPAWKQTGTTPPAAPLNEKIFSLAAGYGVVGATDNIGAAQLATMDAEALSINGAAVKLLCTWAAAMSLLAVLVRLAEYVLPSQEEAWLRHVHMTIMEQAGPTRSLTHAIGQVLEGGGTRLRAPEHVGLRNSSKAIVKDDPARKGGSHGSAVGVCLEYMKGKCTNKGETKCTLSHPMGLWNILDEKGAPRAKAGQRAHPYGKGGKGGKGDFNNYQPSQHYQGGGYGGGGEYYYGGGGGGGGHQRDQRDQRDYRDNRGNK